MTQEWLADWSTYIGDRDDYVTRLTADETARFYESPEELATEQITEPLDLFAYANEMDPCATPDDMS